MQPSLRVSRYSKIARQYWEPTWILRSQNYRLLYDKYPFSPKMVSDYDSWNLWMWIYMVKFLKDGIKLKVLKWGNYPELS